LTVELFFRCDLWLFRWINLRLSNPKLDPWMVALSDFDLFLLGLLILALGLLWLGGFRERAFVVVAVTVFVVGDTLIVGPLKRVVSRPRPYQALSGVRVVDSLGVRYPEPTAQGAPFGSFPSGHACNTAAFATVGRAFYGRAGWLLWVWAGLVGYSRVYGGHHYPSDVLGSWVIGWAYGRLFLSLFRWLWTRAGPRFFPKVFSQNPGLWERCPPKELAEPK
jgi:undecaprenyl-diphosphatase